ncbi:putative Protein kinase domain containing protein [Blattamonas nauphoetae]|uniref:Protein kinase domain-containing protein n=1 Tax=Blattamonas nauphoetae TaxID=2049346 RepID=A0ABQ9XDL0_9EUKA|nr:putative Protein kinase domain containing protein [Blattamonas nauphoetae]
MKVLPFTSEEDFSKNEHEISKLQNNQHPNVVGFVDVLVGDAAHYVVLELCSCSLADRLSELRKLGTMMDRVTVFRIVSDVLAGLGFLHSRNEVYGDVKPSNILIGCDGRTKLGDFGGVVGVGTVKTSNSAECGTMQFWGPEMFAVGVGVGVGVGVSQAGDMWAFGLIVLELLTGESWISGTNGMEIGESVRGFDVVSNPQSRLSSGELIRSGGLGSILGSETPLSQFLREELDTTQSHLDISKQTLVEKERTIQSLQIEKDQIQKENEQLRSELARKTQKLEENERVIAELKQTIPQMNAEVPTRSQPNITSDVIVAFSPEHYRVSRSTVTRINATGWVGCFTKPVSRGIHRLSINNEPDGVMIGVCDAANYPKYLTKEVYNSTKAAMMCNNGGSLYSASTISALNTPPKKGQEWSAEADLEKRTLHFFIDGVQQKHHIINIPVPLVFAIDASHKDESIEITCVLRNDASCFIKFQLFPIPHLILPSCPSRLDQPNRKEDEDEKVENSKHILDSELRLKENPPETLVEAIGCISGLFRMKVKKEEMIQLKGPLDQLAHGEDNLVGEAAGGVMARYMHDVSSSSHRRRKRHRNGVANEWDMINDDSQEEESEIEQGPFNDVQFQLEQTMRSIKGINTSTRSRHSPSSPHRRNRFEPVVLPSLTVYDDEPRRDTVEIKFACHSLPFNGRMEFAILVKRPLGSFS